MGDSIISLQSFYIFNSNYGTSEGEEEQKVLFYHPGDADIDTQIKDVGLSEAIIKFASTFTQEDNCRSLHTQKSSQLFYQPEPDFWMVMKLNAPSLNKTKDNVEYTEYRVDDIHDSVYREILKQSYRMFKLFMGTFECNMKGNNAEEQITSVVRKMDQFFSKYLLTFKLQSNDVLNTARCLHYLPLNKFLFLRVYNFLSMIESTFATIKHSIFLYNDEVVWSGINAQDLYSLCEYLKGTIFPSTSQFELQGKSLTRSFSHDTPHNGSFIIGPDCGENCIKSPKIFITHESVMQSYYLVAYRTLSSTICLLFDDAKPIDKDICQELHSFIGPQLSNIASELREEFNHITNEAAGIYDEKTATPKYLFINDLSLKYSGNLHLDRKFQQNVMNIISDIYRDYNTEGILETTVKTMNDFWIVKQTANWRHFFVIINKNLTLLEVSEEARKIFDQHVKDVFFEK